MTYLKMLNSNIIDKLILTLSLASLFIMLGMCATFNRFVSIPIDPKDSEPKYEYIREIKYFEELPKPTNLIPAYELQHQIDLVPITITYPRVVLYDSYKMFITAYCAEECGWSYMTSSGAECHRASWEHRYDEPTTCAIDLNYFSYGTMFYVPSEDRVYIAEDTGAFSGYWIDLYQDDMSDVIGYSTRYEVCFICEVEEYTQTFYSHAGYKDLTKLVITREED